MSYVPARVVLDSNAVDPLVDDPESYEVLASAVSQGRVELLCTHISIDELAEVPDLERRRHLLLTLVSLGRLVPTGAFVVGYSRLNPARLAEDLEAFEAFRSGDLQHTADALIASTGVAEDADIVTADKRLAGRVRSRSLKSLAMPELVALLAAKT